jgi:DNA uptake protein ComE-like DNA-binding protein
MLPRLTLLLAFVSACGPGVALVDEGEVADGVADFGLSVSSADAADMLALVNHPTTTAALLDDAIGLDARAAKAIIAHRDGPDATLGTADDDLFGSLTELDLVPYVGDAALGKLLSWARAHPLAPPETVEGVAFTSEQVAAVVWGVNQSTSDELDDGLRLDTRAATNLLAKRPFATIAQMGAVSYVGGAVLLALREHAPVWAAKRAGAVTLAGTFDGVSFDEPRARAALKLANVTTWQGLVDGGLPAAGAAPIVGNRPYTSLAQVAAVAGVGPATMRALHALALVQAPVRTVVGDGASCDGTSVVCGVNLVCAGLSYAPSGTCRPSWMANVFRSGTQVSIPDGDVNGVNMGLGVFGLASVAEDVIVHLELTHPRKSDLRVLLTQPSSAQATVWEVDGAGDARVVMGPATGIERDSEVNGEWTLTVIDTRAGSVGTLDGWSLELTSRLD